MYEVQKQKANIRKPAPNSREKEILDHAAAVFAECGYQNTDVQEIADRVGVGKGTVYRHFGTKEHLFLSAVDWGMQQLDSRMKAIREEHNEASFEVIRAVIRDYLSFFDEKPQFVELFILERAEFKDRKRPTYVDYKEANSAYWAEVARDLIDRGLLRDLPIGQTMDFVNNILYGTIFTGAFAGYEQPMADKAEIIFDIIMNGLRRIEPPKESE